ncbi:bifunctional nicotinamidase/pyrazinamidase [Roseiconus nitratireducens]|uniref:bifunctional nicotinamidase/pyrazinamidase n=1 Tax=Roseiconus nitratireducens TaxID=2605748 RepID=UPI001F456A9B|nr:bifunctional nicotinamidase/pyrazinamidase [Roseiconus nitratireducens]
MTADALLLVDLQQDFMPGGALAVPGGDQVVPVANAKMKAAKHVVATRDWHPPGHGSFASAHPGLSIGDTFQLSGLDQVAWPDHCVQGTAGAEFCAGLDRSRIDKIVDKGTDPKVDSYSAFFDNGGQNPTGLDAHLKAIGARSLEVIGLATDYCVLFTVLDARRLGYAVRVDLAGCRGVELNPGDAERAVEQMRRAAATVVQ